ncbi:fructokinase [Rathayibacter sp. PhB93]|uniref:PfkB family carbohydrate kinase n=1 Tax=unclassified Rathayibacter TaxID=2609250 RepID=UPI000F4969E7|nr:MULTISPECIES: PfkB family carbohydrate kinase [unclassified Rathayibacter]ROQ04490.1 fructokinase [Rathayibacter sp. PhB93]TDQ13328.1 fructokinase [Rathayibacter sp. PhB1]
MSESSVSEPSAQAPSASGPAVVVLGDALIDVLRDESGEQRFLGGAAYNVAVGLALLGHRVQLLAMIGDDEDGAAIRAATAEHGVELVPTVGPLGTSVAISERVDGEPHYVFNDAARRRRIRFGARERAVLDVAALVVVSCFPFDDEEQAEELLAAVARPRERLVLDPNPRSGMLADAGRFRRGFERLAERSLLVKIGDDDVALLHGQPLIEVVAQLRGAGTRTVLATRGAQGASLHLEDGTAADAPIASDPRPVIDTMGAGDACLAAAVSSILRRGIPAVAADAAAMLDDCMRIAAATCRARGALLRLPADRLTIAG